MSSPAERPRSSREYLDAEGNLIVLRRGADPAQIELLIVVSEDGLVTGFNGHVDLGTGIRTALTQIIAEELDLPFEQVRMVLGDTDTAPNQGPTIASETIQVSAIPLRQAAAQARAFLLELAATNLGRRIADLRMMDGCIVDETGTVRVGFDSLLKGRRDRLILSTEVATKPVADYRVVGSAVQRVDIPEKATGQWIYVHDVRLPSMLHGRVVRPPYAGLDSGDFVGTSLLSVDEGSVAELPGLAAVVVIRDFVGIVTEREEQAVEAAQKLRITWKPGPELPDLEDLSRALMAQHSQARTLLEQGDVEAQIAHAKLRLQRRYVWPYQMHASIGPSCAVADCRDGQLRVWSGTQNPHVLRADLALLLGMSEGQIEIIRLEAAGCYGRNCADDVAADAALLSRAVGRPVRVQLTREQEHLWEPKGAAQVMDVDGGLADDGSVAAYDFSTRYPSNAAPTLALLLTGTIPPTPTVSDMGDRTAIPPYTFDHMRIVVHDMAPIVRASWLRGVSALPNTFAHESYVDELAAAAQVDPIEFRMRYLHDVRAVDLIRSVAQRADWQVRNGPRKQILRDNIRFGQGIAYARYLHGKFPGTAAAWSAWVAEVEVDIGTGHVHVARVVVGQDSGLVINPAGVQHQIHGNVIQSVSRTLKERVSFDAQSVTSREWGGYPILTFPEVPIIQVVMVPRPDQPPLGVGESASVPSAAAIANAIFDATGVRLREPPFTAERVRSALREANADADADADADDAARAPPRRSSWLRRMGLIVGGSVGLALTLWPWRGAIAPIAPPDPQLYSHETILRGQQLAALGNCAECHTREGGLENTGGRALDTPIGVIYSTNITPDPDTGIGRWSFPAFERAMREGIHRDGRHLYPAFPYTAFALTSEADLQGLYGYLMSQTPVRAETPRTQLAFPFSVRPLLALWNALFLRQGEYASDPSRSAEWNRGAYLVEGLGHCSACHSPRNVLGAERGGSAHLTGGFASGWEAPPLTRLSQAPLPWTQSELFDYLRAGHSRWHGIAAGPMERVVAGLSALPDRDVHAMAQYLASFNAQMAPEQLAARAESLEAASTIRPGAGTEVGERLYAGACAACHDAAAGSLRGLRPSLALNTNLHSARPDNVVHAILDGVNVPALGSQGAMPSFRDSLDDRQIDALLRYLRAQFAADKPAWGAVEQIAARIRAEPVHL
jgi:nicotinate dehydrogenase subunit B